MKYTALILLSAVALAKTEKSGFYPNGCPRDWSIEQLLPHNDCHKFYQCWDGKLVEHTCPSNLYFSVEANQCERSAADCSATYVPEKESEEASEDNSNNGQNVGAGNHDPSKAPEICAAKGSESVLVAHKKCNKYYICNHGVPVARPCQAGTLFNPDIDRCDWPQNVNCGNRVVPDEDNNGDNGNGDGSDNGNDNGDGENDGDNNGDGDNGGNDNGDDNDDQNVGAGNHDHSLAPEICAAEGSESVLVAHKKCNKYYICNHGVPVARPCQAGTLFNPDIDRCDWPQNVDCGNRVVPDEDNNGDNGNGDGSDNGNDNGDGENDGDNNGDSENGGDNNGDGDNGGNDNGDDNDDQNVGAGNHDPSLAPEICAAEGSESVLVAHKKCNKYYICNHGVPVARPCQAGTLFNPDIDRCDWPQNVDCGNRVVPDEENSNGDGSDNGNDNGDGDNGGDNNGDGDNGGDDNGDDNDDQNVGAGNHDPSLAPKICAAEGSESVLVAHEKCNKYYICNHGVPVARPCQAGTLFNPDIDRCDWPQNVDCGNRVVPDEDNNGDNGNGNGSDNGNDNGDGENDGDNNGDSENGGDNNGDGDNGGDDNDDQSVGAGNHDPSLAPKICAAEGSDSVLVAHEKCNKYYICNHGVPVARPCQAGTLFNPDIDRCDWPQNVDCGNRVVPDEDNNGDNGNDDGSDNGNDNGDGDNGGDNNGDGDNGGNDNGDDNDDQNVGAGNHDPSLAPEICAAEGSESVLVAHKKCNKYYICNHGVPVARPCQAGTLFNPDIDRCDWPQNVDCGNRVVPDEDNNGDNGNDDGSDNGNDNGDGDNGGDNNGDGDNGGNDNGDDNDDQNVGAGNHDPSLAPKICAAEGSESVLVAHEKCNKYYICNHGVPVARPCQAGTLFNPDIDRCDWPQNVDCGNRVVPDEENGNGDGSGNGNDNGNGDNGGDNNGDGDNGGDNNGDGDNGGDDNDDQSEGAGNHDPSLAPKICAAEGSESVLVAHEKCNKYYICNHGVPVARPCQAGTLFNPDIDRCDWPQNVDCGNRVVPDEENGNGDGSGNGNDNGNGDNGGDNNGDGDNGGDDNADGDNGGDDNGNDNDDQNVGAGNHDPSLAPEICAAEGSDSVLVAHEKCNKYYICNHGVPVARPCQAGTLFNPDIDRCDWPQNVDCGNRVVPDEENGNGDGSGNGNDNGNGDNGGDNNGEGDNGGDDNADGDNGGDDNGNDNDDQNVGAGNHDPSLAPEICAAEGSDSVLVAHEKCNKYYICNHGVPVARPCQAGTLFNPDIDRCDWPQNVDCGNRVVPDEENGNGDGSGNGNDNGNGDNGGDNNGDGDNGGDDNADGDNGGDDNGNDNDDQNVGAGNHDPSLAPEICAAEGSDSVLVAHKKCNKYYICNHGVPVARPCQAGTLFNPDIDRCDWPQNVDCGNRVVPDEDDNGDNGNGDGSDNGNDNGDGENDGDNNGDGDNGGNDNGDDNDDQNVGAGNHDPSLAPEICAAEGSESVLVAHNKCNKYYICNHGVPVARPCQAGTLFNPDIDRCDWPQNVDCGNRVVPDEENGNGDGSGNGNDNGNGENGGDNNGDGDNGGDDNADGDNGGDDNGNDNDDQNVGAGNHDPSLAPEICAAEGSDSVLVAHKKCNKYYICNHGVPVARPCQAGTLFNPDIDRCDWPQNVDCGNRVVPDEDDNGDNGNGNGSDNGNDNGDGENGGDNNGDGDNGGNDNGDDNDDQNVGAGNHDPSLAPEICAAEGSNNIHIAHKKCNKYYICNHGVPVERPCAAGTFFNPNIDRCDWPRYVDCADRLVPDGDNEENDGADNNEGEQDAGNNNDNGDDNSNAENGNDEADLNDPSQAPVICADNESHGKFMAHEECNKFYVCTHGKPVTLTCAAHLLYNPAVHDCLWPQDVDCGSRIVPRNFEASLNKHLEARRTLMQRM